MYLRRGEDEWKESRARPSAALRCASQRMGGSGYRSGRSKIITTEFRCHEPLNPPGADAEGFSDEHCTVAATGKNVKFEHTEVFPNRAIGATASNEKTAESTKKSTELILTGKTNGLNGEIGCTTVHQEGAVGNIPGPPMWAWGEFSETKITGCTTKGFLGFLGCKVSGGEILVTEKWVSGTTPNSMEVVYEPKKGTTVGLFSLEGAECKTPEGEYAIEGTFAGIPNGATMEFTKESTKGLTIGGVQASLTTKLTIRQTEGEGKFKDPIATTTKVVS